MTGFVREMFYFVMENVIIAFRKIFGIKTGRRFTVSGEDVINGQFTRVLV